MTKTFGRAIVAGAAALVLLPACGGGGGGGGGASAVHPSEALFQPSHIVDVSITLNPADWDALRVQGRSLMDIFGSGCLDGPFPSPFTWFRGTVTIDGRTFTDVAVRKKGFLGSLDETKPSLKLKFDEFVPGREAYGLDRITLNNCKQDPAYVRQALSYAAFARAGVPAPRCNFARVTVNGADLGLFAHVESVDKEFLRRHFSSDAGNLYEGTLSDFRPQWINTFDKKTNESDLDRGDLQAVVTALAAPDADVLGALSAVLDVEGFLTFWAAEVLLGHWDGYANNTNNFFVYADPPGGPFRFMPWGTDGVLVGNRLPGGSSPTSVFARGALARRLYLLPETQTRYLDRLRGLLDTVWDEAAMLAEIDRMEALITPIADPDGSRGLAAAIEEVRDFVRTRRAAIEGELASGPPAWTDPLPDPPCFELVGDVSGTFSTTFGTINAPDPFATGTGTLTETRGATPLTVVRVGATAGPDPGSSRMMAQVIGLLGDGTVDVVALVVDAALFAPGRVVPLDWGSGFGAVFNFNPATGAASLVGFIFGGAVEFDAAAMTPGAAVTGRFTGQIVRFGG